MSNNKSNKIFIVAVMVVVAAVFASFYFLKTKEQAAVPVVEVPPADPKLLYDDYAPKFGMESAPVKLVEFLDPECEACRAMYPIVKSVMTEFPGQVQLIIRYMPLHKNSKLAAISLEAARDQGKYWEAIELLFEKQSEWADHGEPKPELIRKFLSELGLNMKEFDGFVSNPNLTWRINKDFEDGKKLGVSRTPTFFVNGKILEQMGPDPLRAAISNALRK